MVKGIAEVQADLIRRVHNVRLAAKNEARSQGTHLAAAMRILAPVQSGADGGDLRRSIRVEDANTVTTRKGERDYIGVVVRAGDETTIVTNSSGQRFQNARLQEFGTATMGANSYFYPAWKANRRSIRGAITRAIRKAWTA